MKKSYVKPQVFYEDFRLSASIAAICPKPISEHGNGECGITLGPITYYMGEIAGCTKKVDNDGDMSICYHNPTDATNLFNSQ